MWSNAQVGRDKAALAEMDAGWLLYVRLLGLFGVTSLAVIFVVLIVIWMGYVKRVPWTWFVMFIIVWVWAFPSLVLPYLGVLRMLNLAELRRLLNAAGWNSEGTSVLARNIVEQVLIFSLMLIALILPIKSFFKPGNQRQTNQA